MALALYDRVQQTGTANTTVSFTLSGSVTGYQSFSVVGNGNTTYYGATDTSGNWEVGIGTYSTTGPTLTRTTILASSNSGSAVTFSGTVTVFVTYPSERSVNLDGSGNVSALGTVSSGTWNGSTIPVAYGGTGVTSSSGANSVMLRDANQNVSINRLNQSSTTTTAAGTTTTLTAASTFSQILNGTGGQTFKLPDATTLTNTTTFEFNNNATGTLTIVDNASGAVGTITSGGAAAIALLSNGTIAGTWDVHAYIPENVQWGTNSLALGSTVITGGTWNGGTIPTGYGGTGLTTFSAANNALYSTSSSALAAGTLPVLAGGTGVTTSTGSGSTVLNTSPTLVTPLLGTPTSGTLTNCTGLPISSGVSGLGTGVATFLGTPTSANLATAVTDETGSGSLVFATSPTLVTPLLGTPTSGNLANCTGYPAGSISGTLGISSGGTGQTTATAAFNALSPITTTGDLIIGNGTNSATRLGIGTNGYILQSNGTTASWAANAGSTTLTTTDFTATSGQTTFSVTYTPTLLQGVYRNGIKLGQADYTATNGTSVVLATGAITGDLIQVQYFSSLSTTTAVNSISFGSTGLTPSTASTGAVTVAGTLAVANGGTGVTTSTGTGDVVLSTRPTMSVTGSGFTLQDATDNTKTANFVLSGLTTGTNYTYALPATSGSTLAALAQAQTFTATQTFTSSVIQNSGAYQYNSAAGNWQAASQTTGTFTVGGTSQTGTITLGRSTASQQTDIQAGATASGSTKTINLGTGGLAGSTTNITVGSTTGTSTTNLQGNLQVNGSAGTSGYVLTSNGAGAAPTWAAAAGATITGTTTAGTYYVVGTTSTSGSLTTASISNTNAVSYNASTGALTAVSMVSSSDERLKSNIQTLTNAVQTVENLRGVSYLRNDRPEIGVVAQEVEKVLPMLVHEDPEGYKSVAYGNMVGLLIEAIKELSAEVKALKAELNK